MLKKKILVVGGAGFIGSLVNKVLHDQGYDTVVFDNLIKGNRRRVKWGTFIKGDIKSPRALEKLFQQHHFAAVMHFAALIDVGESVLHPDIYYKNNVVGTLNLLETMHKHQVSTFIFSSSAAVYGMPQHHLIEENHPTHPINPYGQTKLMVEKLLDDFDAAYGIKSAKLRYFNAAGGDPDGIIQNDNQKKSNLIPIVLESIKRNLPVTIYGTDYPTPDGTCIRDYIHIYDLATAHILAMEKLFQDRVSQVYNLGNGNGFSVREVIRVAEKVSQRPVTIIEGDRRPGDPPYLLANATKAKQQLNWIIKYPTLESMISHAYLSNVNRKPKILRV